MVKKVYFCIDLKSFYASVECQERGLDCMTTDLVVADPERGNGTICLAVSPSLKAKGVKNRCRFWEIQKYIDQNPKYRNTQFITATPQMAKYIEYSANIYEILLSYFSEEDIYPYSIDESFMDITEYLDLYKLTPRELAKKVMDDILTKTGIRSTAGVGSNLYLCKVALDILAKHSPDFIGELDEELFKEKLWKHRPLTDFWRIGPGTASKLEKYGILCMKDIAESDEELIYRLFGKDGELIIDHAWGHEPVTINDIKNYKSKNHSLSNGQVLMRDYSTQDARLIVKEMTELLCLDLVDKDLVCKSFSLYIGYSHNYAQTIPSSNSTVQLDFDTSSNRIITPAIARLYDSIVKPGIPVRRINISANNVTTEECHQFNFFVDYSELEKDTKIQKAVLEIQKKFGKNSVLKGMNLQENAMTRIRNCQIGGHKA